MDSFCILPFVQVAGKTSGTYRLCCTSPNSDIKPHKTMGKDSISDVWNSSYYKEVRMKMLRGEKVDHCDICYKTEAAGSESRREHHNKVWMDHLGEKEINKIKEEVEKSSGENNSRPLSFDLRLGNLCNLKCRMCNSMTSTSFAGEWERIRNEGHDLTRFKGVDDLHTNSKKLSNWFQSEEFWDDIDKELDTIKRLYLTGGEPTLIKRNNDFLLNLIEKKNFDVEVILNTNITMLNDDFLSNLEKFNNVSLSMSIDGIGKVNDYIRYPSKWQDIEKNIDAIFKRNINIVITYTLSAYNFFDLKNFMTWLLNFAFEKLSYVDWNILDEPEFLAISTIPFKVRSSYIKELNLYLNKIETKENEVFITSLKNIFPLLLVKDSSETHMKTFLKYTKIMDKIRGCSLLDVITDYNFIKSEYDSL